jgi:hypothetical protein
MPVQRRECVPVRQSPHHRVLAVRHRRPGHFAERLGGVAHRQVLEHVGTDRVGHGQRALAFEQNAFHLVGEFLRRHLVFLHLVKLGRNGMFTVEV